MKASFLVFTDLQLSYELYSEKILTLNKLSMIFLINS